MGNDRLSGLCLTSVHRNRLEDDTNFAHNGTRDIYAKSYAISIVIQIIVYLCAYDYIINKNKVE